MVGCVSTTPTEIRSLTHCYDLLSNSITWRISVCRYTLWWIQGRWKLLTKGGCATPTLLNVFRITGGQSECFNDHATQLLITHDGFNGYTSVLIAYNWCSELREHFMGMYMCSNSKAATLYTMIQDVLTRLGLPLTNLRGHCFDGASSMSGCIRGVQKLITEKQPLSVFVHSCNHALHLALQAAARDVKLIRDTLQTARDGANIGRESSERQDLFESLYTASDIGN